MVPAAVVDTTLHDLVGKLEKTTWSSTAENSYYIDDIRRAKELPPRESTIRRRTSGVLGARTRLLPNDGGETAVRKASRSDLQNSCPGARQVDRTPGRDKVPGTAEEGYLHCGPSGAGHFVKMSTTASKRIDGCLREG